MVDKVIFVCLGGRWSQSSPWIRLCKKMQ